MRAAWLGLVACLGCGRVGFEPFAEGARVDALGTTGDPSVMRVNETGGGNPYPIWNGEAFVVVSNFFEWSSYQTFSVTGVPLGEPTPVQQLGYVLQTISVANGIGVLSMNAGSTTLTSIDRSGTETSNIVVASSSNARIAKNLTRDELCLVWADSDSVGPQRSVRAARTTSTGARIGSELVVITGNNRYRRLDVGCRGDELYVLFSVEVDGWYDHYLHTFIGTTTQLPDTLLLSAISRLRFHDVILLGENLGAPIVAHGEPGLRIQIDSFDLAAPGPLGGPQLDCAAQYAIVEWDGQNASVVAPCFDTAAMRDTLYVMSVTPQGETARPPIAVQTATDYGGGPTQLARSPTGHVAVGFTEWNVNLEATQGFVGFLAP